MPDDVHAAVQFYLGYLALEAARRIGLKIYEVSTQTGTHHGTAARGFRDPLAGRSLGKCF
jgi:hypothetical protein